MKKSGLTYGLDRFVNELFLTLSHFFSLFLFPKANISGLECFFFWGSKKKVFSGLWFCKFKAMLLNTRSTQSNDPSSKAVPQFIQSIVLIILSLVELPLDSG